MYFEIVIIAMSPKMFFCSGKSRLPAQELLRKKKRKKKMQLKAKPVIRVSAILRNTRFEYFSFPFIKQYYSQTPY